MFEANAKLPKTIGWCQLCCISQELILFTYTVEKGKLQHAAVYDVKIRME